MLCALAEETETINEFFVNVAKDIGKDSCAVNQEHQSWRNLFPVCQMWTMCQTYQTFAGPTYFLQLQLNYTYTG
jgi:hypothetical protein